MSHYQAKHPTLAEQIQSAKQLTLWEEAIESILAKQARIGAIRARLLIARRHYHNLVRLTFPERYSDPSDDDDEAWLAMGQRIWRGPDGVDGTCLEYAGFVGIFEDAEQALCDAVAARQDADLLEEALRIERSVLHNSLLTALTT